MKVPPGWASQPVHELFREGFVAAVLRKGNPTARTEWRRKRSVKVVEREEQGGLALTNSAEEVKTRNMRVKKILWPTVGIQDICAARRELLNWQEACQTS